MDVVLDRSIVNSIKELADSRGSSGLLRELIDLFRTQAELARTALADAVEIGDTGVIRHHAHKLKGSSANLGASDLASRCQVLEHLAKQGVADLAALRLAFRQVENAIDRSLESLRRELDA